MHSEDSVGCFLERQAQLDQLAALLTDAAELRPRLGGVVAEAGAGKSRLVEEMRRLHSDRATFLVGRAFQATATSPYAVWVDALEPHLRRLPRRELLHILASSTDLPRLFPSCTHLGIEPPSGGVGEIETEQTRLFGQMAAMLSRMARDRALVLVLDNLQWADASSIELLHAVMRSLEGCRLLVLGLYRGDGLRADSRLRVCFDSLRRLELGVEIAVPPLSVAATGTILEAESGRDWPAGAVHQLHHLTQGNALFVREFGKHAAARGAGAPLEWDSLEELPGTVQALLGERLWDLDEDCRRVLAFAAAFEAPIRYELLVALTRFAEERLLDAMDRLCAMRFLSESVRDSSVFYEFHKPLVQATIYRSIGAARRQYLHRLIATEGIRAGDQDAATIARHLIAGAAAGNHAEALPYLLRASKDAVSAFGNHEAISLLTSALKVAGAQPEGDPDLLTQIYLDLGESNKRLGRFDQAIAAWTEALPKANPRLSIILRRCIARTRWQSGRELDALQVLEDGISRLDHADLSEEAGFLRQEYALALARQGRLHEALDQSATALRLADEERQPEVTARIYIGICLAHGYRGDLRSAMQAIGKAIRLCEDLPYPGAAFLAHYTMAGLLRYEGDIRDFEEQSAACMRIAERMHSVALASWPLSIRIERYAFDGRIREAIDMGERALALDQTTGQGAVLPRTHAFLAVACRLAGDLPRARHHLQESRRLVRELGKRELRVVAVQTCCEAFVEFHDGNFETALSLVNALNFSISAESPIAFYALHPYALPLAAEAATRLGKAEEAHRLLSEIRRLAKASSSACEASMLYVHALLKAAAGEIRTACDEAARAAALWDAHGRPFDAARARVDLAGWLSNQGEDDLAAARLNEAGSIFSRIGAVREAASVGQKLRKYGRKPVFVRQRQSIGQPVSQRESEVIGLVTQGKSNKEIAAQLFLSELTIETHMKNILRKLGLKSRAQVAAYEAHREAYAQSDARVVPIATSRRA